MAKRATEKWVKIGIGAPRKFTHYIKKPWYSGKLNVKQTIELLQKLRDHGYQQVSWTLQPNKFLESGPGQWPYHISLGYWGVEDEKP